MDVSVSDARGMLLQYCVGVDWLNDDASASAVTRRILDYHPLEPKMWLQLSANDLPQCTQGVNNGAICGAGSFS